MGLQEFKAYLRSHFEKRNRCGECGRSKAAEQSVDQPLSGTPLGTPVLRRSDTARTVGTERSVHFVETAEICGEESHVSLTPSGTKELAQVSEEDQTWPTLQYLSESSSMPRSATDLSFGTAMEPQSTEFDLDVPIVIPPACMGSSPCPPCPRQDADDMDSFDMWAVAYGPPSLGRSHPATPTSVWTAETPCLLVPRPSRAAGIDGASPPCSARGAPYVKEA